MKTLKNLEKLSITELIELDNYYSENINEALLFTDNEIIEAINYIEEKTYISSFLSELEIFFALEGIDAAYFFTENVVNTYIRYIGLMKKLNLNPYKFETVIADYYNDIDKEKAMKYYTSCFKPGFDLTETDYYYSLVKYLKNLNINPVDKLTELIENSPNENEVSLDYVDTLQLRIINLKKDDPRYIKYIDESIIPSTRLARKIQEENKNSHIPSDSDEERNLCELLVRKQEYYVLNKDYINAMKYYHELTNEIGRSDCTRYYHARDLFYNNMLKEMSKTYKELEFLEGMKTETFEIVNEYNKLSDLKEITLKNNAGNTFSFIVNYVHKEENITITPKIPIIGEGGKYHLTYKKENGKNLLYYW